MLQGIITLLFLIAMIVSLYNQQKKKEEQSRENRKKLGSLFKETKEKHSKKKVEAPEVQDLKDRHIKSNIKFTPIKERKKSSSLERIDRLSVMKKAIIWKEILDRP